MEYDFVRFRNRLKAHLLEFKICYLRDIDDQDKLIDEMFKSKREIVYAPSKVDAVHKVKQMYSKCAIVGDFKVIKVCNIR